MFLAPQLQEESLKALALAKSKKIHQLGIMEVLVNRKPIIVNEEMVDFEGACLRAAEDGDCGLLLLLWNWEDQLIVPFSCLADTLAFLLL